MQPLFLILRRMRQMHPASLLTLSFLAVIAAGTGLLLLPISTVEDISGVDALFTSTSAVCVTGLIVKSTGHDFTLFGQCVILLLFQLGGLGIMTVSVFVYRLLGKTISYRQRTVIQDVLSHTPRPDIFGLLKSVLIFTVIAEFLGFCFLLFFWAENLPWGRALWVSLFHSVSAFCNAGFCLFDTSLIDYRGSALINFTVGLLIIAGGIGFPAVYEVFYTCYSGVFLKRFRRRRSLWSVQTKVVLIVSAILIGTGMLVFWIGESSVLMQDLNWKESFLVSFFQSVTCRTAGFNTVSIAGLNNTTLLFMLFLMFVGGSPASCAGGIKTTTLAVISVSTWSRIKRNFRVNMFRKSIPYETITQSISLVIISLTFIGAVVFLLTLTASGHGGVGGPDHDVFLTYLFETVSAFGTVGLSMGGTETLNLWGKLLIALTMIVGRVGVLTFAYVLAGPEPYKGVEFSEENIMVG